MPLFEINSTDLAIDGCIHLNRNHILPYWPLYAFWLGQSLLLVWPWELPSCTLSVAPAERL